jgi:hypothetical protein
MIVGDNSRQKVELQGEFVGEQQAFRINNSAMAFRILSSGLYSDQIKAVIRELSTNAWDAHLEAGKGDVPFKVHMPTRFEPWFAVQDFGVGMDHTRVMDNYTTYFGSSKQGTNELVGCLGLGSKSPFAYTETFTLVSTKDLVKRTYTALISDEGFPKVMMISEEPTEDSNGVMVMFPVKIHDISDFHSKARVVFADFPTTPEFNTLNGGVTKVEYELKADKWGFRKTNLGWGVDVRVIQGCVGYPLDDDQIGFSHPLLDSPIDLYVPIGAVEVTPSRESLNYTEATRRNIKILLEEVAASVKDNYVKRFESCKTRIEALLLMNRLRREGGKLFGVIENDLYKHQYTSFKLTADRIKLDQLDYMGLNAATASFHNNKVTLDSIFFEHDERLDMKAGKSNRNQEVSFGISEEPMVIYNDLPSGICSLLHRACSKFQGKKVFVVSPVRHRIANGFDKSGNERFKWSFDSDGPTLGELFALELDTTPVMASSFLVEFPATPKERRKSSFTTRIRSLERYRRYDHEETVKWSGEDVEQDLDAQEGKTKLYVKILVRTVDDSVTGPSGRMIQLKDNVSMARFYDSLVALKIIERGVPIFGIPPKDLESVESDPEWQHLPEFVVASAQAFDAADLELVAALEHRHVLDNLNVLQSLSNSRELSQTWIAGLLAPYTATLSAHQKVNGYYSGNRTRAETMRNMLRDLGIKIPTIPDGISELQDRLQAEHPILFSVNSDARPKYILMAQRLMDLEQEVAELRANADKESAVA